LLKIIFHCTVEGCLAPLTHRQRTGKSFHTLSAPISQRGNSRSRLWSRHSAVTVTFLTFCTVPHLT